MRSKTLGLARFWTSRNRGILEIFSIPRFLEVKFLVRSGQNSRPSWPKSGQVNLPGQILGQVLGPKLAILGSFRPGLSPARAKVLSLNWLTPRVLCFVLANIIREAQVWPYGLPFQARPGQNGPFLGGDQVLV